MATESKDTKTGTTEQDIASQLLARGTRTDGVGTIADLKTLQEIRAAAQEYRVSLGLAENSTDQTDKVVAVSSGTDLEKDNTLVGFLNKHPEIETVKPEVLLRLGRMSGALTAAEEASTPIALNLLQAVLDLDKDNQDTAQRVADLLAQPPDTVIAPGLTVRDAQLILGNFVRTQATQQQTEQNRQDRQRRHKNKTGKQVGQEQQGLQDQQSVRRLRAAAVENQALPAPKAKDKKKGTKTPA